MPQPKKRGVKQLSAPMKKTMRSVTRNDALAIGKGGKGPPRKSRNMEQMPTFRRGGPGGGRYRTGPSKPGMKTGTSRYPARPAGYFGGGAKGLAKRQRYQAARSVTQQQKQLRGSMNRKAATRRIKSASRRIGF